jgi:hypothetical protein
MVVSALVRQAGTKIAQRVLDRLDQPLVSHLLLIDGAKASLGALLHGSVSDA